MKRGKFLDLLRYGAPTTPQRTGHVRLDRRPPHALQLEFLPRFIDLASSL